MVGWSGAELQHLAWPCSEDGLEHLASCSHVLSSIPPLGLPLYDPVCAWRLVPDVIMFTSVYFDAASGIVAMTSLVMV